MANQEDSSPDGEQRRGSGSMSAGAGGKEDGGAAAKGAPVLKRGSACLYCRKRKLKCTGVIPCPLCVRSNIECTLDDPSKPRSRIALLEQKISELESQLNAQGPPSPQPTPSSSSSRLNPRERHPSSSSFPYPKSKPTMRGGASRNVDEQEAFSLALQELFSGNQVPHAEGGSIPQMDSSFWNFEGEPSSSSFDLSSPSEPLDLTPFPSTTFATQSFNASPSTFTAPSSSDQSPGGWAPSSSWNGGGGVAPEVEWGDGTMPDGIGMRDHLLSLFYQRRRQFSLVHDVSRFFSSLDAPPDRRPAPALLFAMYTCAARFSPEPSIRTLEDTFLSLARHHINIGTVLFKDHRLVQVLQASIVLSAFSLSSFLSSSGRVRSSLADELPFLSFTAVAFKANYLEGWMQGGTSIRLAIACRLNRISAMDIGNAMECFAQGQPVPPPVRQWPAAALTPPQDGTELGERIHAFWGAFLMDQAHAVAIDRVHLSHDEVETPFPRPLEEYQQGTVNEFELRSIQDIYSDEPRRGPASLGGVLDEAIALFVDSFTLRNHYAHPSLRATYLARPRQQPAPFSPASTSYTKPSSSTGSSTHSPSQSVSSNHPSVYSHSPRTEAGPPSPKPLPEAIARVEKALNNFIDHLPAEHRDPSQAQIGGIPPWTQDLVLAPDQGTPDGPSPLNTKIGISPVLFSLHVIIRTSFMLVYSQAALFDPRYRPKVLEAASSAVQLIHLIVDIDFSQLDTWLIVPWIHQARALAFAAKSLALRGQAERASSLVNEIEVLVLAMRRLGQVWNSGTNIADKMSERMKTLSAAD